MLRQDCAGREVIVSELQLRVNDLQEEVTDLQGKTTSISSADESAASERLDYSAERSFFFFLGGGCELGPWPECCCCCCCCCCCSGEIEMCKITICLRRKGANESAESIQSPEAMWMYVVW